MLELKNIHKSFGDVRVLNGVNLHLEKGFVYTLKGGNGSGKTTLINIISGFLKPDKGSIELKAGKFIPEFAGKLNYYLSAVDSQLRKHDDNPTIGILLCKKKNKIDVEYALRDIHKPMGISEYILTNAIPDNIKPQLPSVEELERELEKRQLE